MAEELSQVEIKRVEKATALAAEQLKAAVRLKNQHFGGSATGPSGDQVEVAIAQLIAMNYQTKILRASGN